MEIKNSIHIIHTALADCFQETDGLGHWTVASTYLLGALAFLHVSEEERDKKEKSKPIVLLSDAEKAKRIAVRVFWESEEDENVTPPHELG
jgi:hypothetical protein